MRSNSVSCVRHPASNTEDGLPVILPKLDLELPVNNNNNNNNNSNRNDNNNKNVSSSQFNSGNIIARKYGSSWHQPDSSVTLA